MCKLLFVRPFFSVGNLKPKLMPSFKAKPQANYFPSDSTPCLSTHDSDSSVHYKPGEPLVVLEQPDFAVSAVELLEGDVEGRRGDAGDAGCQFNSIKIILAAGLQGVPCTRRPGLG